MESASKPLLQSLEHEDGVFVETIGVKTKQPDPKTPNAPTIESNVNREDVAGTEKEIVPSKSRSPLRGRKLCRFLMVLGGLASLSGCSLYYLTRTSTPTATPIVRSISTPPEDVKCFADEMYVPKGEPLRIMPCVSSSGRVIPRLNRSDYSVIKNLILHSGFNLLEGQPENGLTTLALEILADFSSPSKYIDFRQFTDFDMLIADNFAQRKQVHFYDVLKATEKVLSERVSAGHPPMLMVFDHFEVALKNAKFQAERFFSWVFEMEHKGLLRSKFLSSDAKLASAMREIAKWKLVPIAVPPISKVDIKQYLGNVTVLTPKAIDRVSNHNMAIVSRVAAQYLRDNDAEALNVSLDECLKRMSPRSDFLAQLGWAQ